MLSAYFSDIINNSWFQIGVSLLLGSLLTHILRVEKVKKLTYLINGFPIVLRNSIQRYEHLDFTFKGESVEALTLTRIGIWSNGTDTIHGADITQKDRLRILPVEDVSILDYKVVYANNNSNDIKLEPYFKEGGEIDYLEVTFDYLDRNNGVVVQLFHTGKDKSSVGLAGSIKGVKHIPEASYVEPFLNFRPFARRGLKAKLMALVPHVMAVTYFTVLVFAFFRFYSKASLFVTVAFVATILIMGGYLFYSVRYSFRQGVPKDLLQYLR